ncbi:MAG: hypothetical protein KKE17_12360 [Proteobacteria bacterium]|nr:hypothetical protein [Pseudomonadota bacterium]
MSNSGARKTAIKATTLQGFILNLRKIPGYAACGILSSQGKVLARDLVATTVDLELLGTTCNSLLQQSQDAAEYAGMQSCSQFSIKTPTGRQVLIRCSGKNATLHFHLLVALGEEADISRIDREMDSFVDLVNHEFSQ